MASRIFVEHVLRVKLHTHANALLAAILEACRNEDEDAEVYAVDLAFDCHALYRLLEELNDK